MAYTHLSEQERYQIEQSLHRQVRVSVIAQVLGRSRGTIYRELARLKRAYSAQAAQAHRGTCAARSAGNARRYGAAAWAEVQAWLAQDWSPQQVAGRCVRLHQQCPSWQAIYHWVRRTWAAKQCRPLRWRPRRKSALAWAKAATPIGKRPAHIALRTEVGHWEADSMLGMRGVGKERVLVMVERASRYTRLVWLDNGYAASAAQAIERHLLNNKKLPFKSLTVDRGSEFRDLPQLLGKRLYVCDPQRPNQRGTNENTIGLIRQYIPKGVPISLFDAAQLRRIEQKLNSRPRQCLSFKTPSEVLSEMHPRCCASN